MVQSDWLDSFAKFKGGKVTGVERELFDEFLSVLVAKGTSLGFTFDVDCPFLSVYVDNTRLAGRVDLLAGRLDWVDGVADPSLVDGFEVLFEEFKSWMCFLVREGRFASGGLWDSGLRRVLKRLPLLSRDGRVEFSALMASVWMDCSRVEVDWFADCFLWVRDGLPVNVYACCPDVGVFLFEPAGVDVVYNPFLDLWFEDSARLRRVGTDLLKYKLYGGRCAWVSNLSPLTVQAVSGRDGQALEFFDWALGCDFVFDGVEGVFLDDPETGFCDRVLMDCYVDENF